MDKPLCKRCFIRETGEKEIMDSIKQFWKESKPETICSAKEYEKRLSFCKDCKNLSFGICMKSGFYVEARAYRLTEHCPINMF